MSCHGRRAMIAAFGTGGSAMASFAIGIASVVARTTVCANFGVVAFGVFVVGWHGVGAPVVSPGTVAALVLGRNLIPSELGIIRHRFFGVLPRPSVLFRVGLVNFFIAVIVVVRDLWVGDTRDIGHENLSVRELAGDLLNGWAGPCVVVVAVTEVAGERQLCWRRDLPVGVGRIRRHFSGSWRSSLRGRLSCWRGRFRRCGSKIGSGVVFLHLSHQFVHLGLGHSRSIVTVSAIVSATFSSCPMVARSCARRTSVREVIVIFCLLIGVSVENITLLARAFG